MKLLERLSSAGKIPLCNCRPDRGIWIKNVCFPLCLRCSVIISSYLIFSQINLFDFPCSLSLILCIPCAIDGFAQYFMGFESNQYRRFVTGFLFGIGLSGFTL